MHYLGNGSYGSRLLRSLRILFMTMGANPVSEVCFFGCRPVCSVSSARIFRGVARNLSMFVGFHQIG